MSLYNSSLQSSCSSESNQPEEMQFQISDYLEFSDAEYELQCSLPTSDQQLSPILQANDDHVSESSIGISSKTSVKVKSFPRKSSIKVAFKTKSDLEILDDGYKWRKYGKKMVKNSPNPRNYYRCSTEGCDVKKRVERQREDSSYVITTYEGIHNHHIPSASKSKTGF